MALLFAFLRDSARKASHPGIFTLSFFVVFRGQAPGKRVVWAAPMRGPQAVTLLRFDSHFAAFRCTDLVIRRSGFGALGVGRLLWAGARGGACGTVYKR